MSEARMGSPFPGMDPYLEARWSDVHGELSPAIKRQLRRKLPEGLTAHLYESIVIDAAAPVLKRRSPDVRIMEDAGISHKAAMDDGAVAVAEPLLVPMESEPQRLYSVQILDRFSGNRIVTVVEVISPANKHGQVGREQYQTKQREMLQGGVNLVEIDLIREGNYILAAPFDNLPAEPFPYYVCAVRASRPENAEVYPISLRERLPNVRIPLRESDADVILELQPLIDFCYEEGDYRYLFDYGREPTPRLSIDDARWADELLRGKGLR